MGAAALLGVASALAAAVPRRAAAADEVEAVRFAYEAPAACPDAEGFVEEVRARTTRFRIVQSGSGLRSFEVRIAVETNGITGTVRVVDGTGVVSARTVEGAQCEDVAKTLAFVTAISIDPKALPGHDAPPATTTSTPPPGPENETEVPAPPSSASLAPPASTPGPLPRPTIATAAPQEAVALQAAPSPAAQTWHATVGVGASAQGLGAPGALFGETAFVGLALDTQSIWSPELRIGAAQTSSGTLGADPGSVSLAWIVARADACPLRWPAQGRLAARPCLTADVGALSASASDGVQHAQSVVRPWGTLGARALVEWEPVGPLFIGAEVSLSAALQRDQFYVAPTPTVYQAPVVLPAGTLELGVRFP